MVITIKEEDKSKFIDLSMFDESNLMNHLAKYFFCFCNLLWIMETSRPRVDEYKIFGAENFL